MACAQYEHTVIACSMAHNADAARKQACTSIYSYLNEMSTAAAWFIHWSNTTFNPALTHIANDIRDMRVSLTNLTSYAHKVSGYPSSLADTHIEFHPGP